MSALVPGKRYLFSFNVRVDSTGDAYIEDTGRRVDDSLMRGATVEELPDPLPTTPGSIVQVRSTNPHLKADATFLYARTSRSDGRHWVGLVGADAGVFFTDEQLDGAFALDADVEQ